MLSVIAGTWFLRRGQWHGQVRPYKHINKQSKFDSRTVFLKPTLQTVIFVV